MRKKSGCFFGIKGVLKEGCFACFLLMFIIVCALHFTRCMSLQFYNK